METLGAEIAVPPTFLDPTMSVGVPIPHSDLGESKSHDWEGNVPVKDVDSRVNAILDDAADRARRSAVRFPRSARANSNLGFALLNRGLLEEAAGTFERALELDPGYVHAIAGLGQVRLSQDRLEEASAAFTALIESRPSDPAAVLGLATVALRRKDLGEAARLFEHAVVLEPESVLARYHLGMALASLGCAHDAIAELREAIGVSPRLAVLHVGLGRAYAQAGDRRRALREFRVALSLVPGAVEAIHGLARVLVDEGDAPSAVAILDDLLGHDPADNEARELRAWAFFRLGEFKRARNEIHQVIAAIDRSNPEEMASQARLLNNLGTCYWLLGNLDDAERQFAHSIGLEPDAPTPYHNLGRLFLIERRPGEAVPILGRCRDRFPSDTTSRLLLVAALDRIDRSDEAIAELDTWVRGGEAPREAWGRLGYLLTDRKREPRTAVAVLREASALFPNDPGVANNLAYAYLMLGDTSAARKVLEGLGNRRVGQDPFEATVVLRATWGLLYLREGDRAGAEEGYRQAEELALRHGDPSLAIAVQRKRHLEFARALLRGGNVEAAQSEIRHGLAVAGDDPYRFRRDLRELSASLRVKGLGSGIAGQQEPTESRG